MQGVKVKISGMSCQHCVMAVEKSIRALDGVADLKVEIGSATVSFDESKLSKEDIEQAVVKAGYKISE